MLTRLITDNWVNIDQNETEQASKIHINNWEELTNGWFKWVAENPAKARHIHTALYLFLVFHNGLIKWPDKFILSPELIKHHLGEKATSTYAAALNDLVEWGFVLIVKRGVNQFKPTLISLKFTK